MRSIEKSGIVISILCVCFIIINALFIYPTADDFSYYIDSQEKGFWEFQKWHYLNWGGRYTPNALLGSFALDGVGLWIYRLISILIAVGLFGAFILFVKKVFKIKELIYIYYFSCILFLGYTLSLYSIAQQFYWLPGSLTYTFSCILCLIIWSFWESLYRWQFFLPIFLATFLVNGTNEISILLFNCSLVLIFVYQFFNDKKIHRHQYIIIAFSFIFGAISILAPGNRVRAESIDFENVNSILFSLPRTISRSGILLFEHFYTIFFIVLAILPFVEKLPSFRINIPDRFKNIFKLSLVMFPFLVLLLGVFPSYWATGKIPPARTVNTVGFFFMLSMVFSLLVYYSNFGISTKLLSFTKKNNIGMGLLLVSLVFLPNYLKTSIKDLFSGKSYQFSKDMEQRIHHIKITKDENVEISPIELPSITYKEITEDPNYFYNRAYAKYYKKKSIVLKRK